MDYWNGGGRNAYTLIPHLFTPTDNGDQTGQIYHFLGFVALIFSNGPAKGYIMGQTTSYGYEIVRPWLLNQKLDYEDYEIDHLAMAFAIGFWRQLRQLPTPDEAHELYRKQLCAAPIHQKIGQINSNGRKCTIWLGHADSYKVALDQIPELKGTRSSSYIHLPDMTNCSKRATRAVKEFSFRPLPNGKKPNFAYFRFNDGSKNARWGIVSNAFPSMPLGHGLIDAGEVTPLCREANAIGGNCGALRKRIFLKYCPGKADKMQSCIKANKPFLLQKVV